MPKVYQGDYGFRIDSKLAPVDNLYMAMRVNAFIFNQLNTVKNFNVKKDQDFFYCSDEEFTKIKNSIHEYLCLMESKVIK